MTRRDDPSSGRPPAQPQRPRPADGAPVAQRPDRAARDVEVRVFGLNACRAVFEVRPGDIRKVYLLEARLPVLKDLLAWCAKSRIGYRLVGAEDLEKLTQTTHHEGLCMDVLRRPPRPLAEFLADHRDRARPSLLVWLDGVGNPHNFGAVLRVGAHFGMDGVLLPPGSTLALSGAACRVAEGGAERVALVATGDPATALKALQRAGYATIATVVRGGDDLYARPLPPRCVLVFGAESAGVSGALARVLERHLRIPGTGAVESLNIATAVGVAAGEFWRQHQASVLKRR
jgi:TrmH RNA methyltransferase